jgi:hypothetical protein
MRSFRLLAIISFFAFPVCSFANTITISSTGTGGGATDSNYSVGYSPSTPTPGVAASPTYIITGNPGWVSPIYGTSYISDSADGASSGAGGYFTFTTTFDLTGDNLATVDIAGEMAADNAVALYLNGVYTGFVDPYDGPEGYGFAHFTGFDLTTGFISGVNTLQFVVQNGNFGSDAGGPIGLDASVSGTASAAPAVPEPSSLMLFGTGILGVAGFARRKFLRS